MGHSIQHYTFDINKSKKDIAAIADEDAIYGSDNRSGLHSDIRFLENKVYSDIDKAHEAIERLDKGWYDQLAVQFYDYEKVKDTKTIINLEDRINKARENLNKYKETNAIKNRKTNFVGCPKCGSKINKEYVSDYGYAWNTCPLCKEDLSSNTIKENIANRTIKTEEMIKDLHIKRRENNKKGKKTIKWLVKTEYHI